jgi:hypothetical protein
MSDHGTVFFYCVANDGTLDADAERNSAMSVDRDGKRAVAHTGKRIVFSTRVTDRYGKGPVRIQRDLPYPARFVLLSKTPIWHHLSQ